MNYSISHTFSNIVPHLWKVLLLFYLPLCISCVSHVTIRARPDDYHYLRVPEQNCRAEIRVPKGWRVLPDARIPWECVITPDSKTPITVTVDLERVDFSRPLTQSGQAESFTESHSDSRGKTKPEKLTNIFSPPFGNITIYRIPPSYNGKYLFASVIRGRLGLSFSIRADSEADLQKYLMDFSAVVSAASFQQPSI